MAINAVKDDDALRNKYVDQGVAFIDRAIDPNDPRAPYLLRKGILQLNRNQSVDENVAATFNQLIAVLDAEPEYANPGNKNNYLAEYVTIYNLLAPYYERIGDQAAADNAKAKSAQYKAIKDGTVAE